MGSYRFRFRAVVDIEMEVEASGDDEGYVEDDENEAADTAWAAVNQKLRDVPGLMWVEHQLSTTMERPEPRG